MGFMYRSYLSELEAVCQSSVVDTVAGFAACVHIIPALQSGRSHISNNDDEVMIVLA